MSPVESPTRVGPIGIKVPIRREINPENRRKYMLKTTSKANEIVPKVRQISKDWEMKVGLTEADENLKRRIKEISINSMNIIGK